MFEIQVSDKSMLDDAVDILSKFGDFYYKNGVIYLFIGEYKPSKIIKQLTKLLGAGNFIVRSISPKNYDSYPQNLSDWMKNKSYDFEVAKIEKERQEDFLQFKESMTLISELLNKDKGGGVDDN